MVAVISTMQKDGLPVVVTPEAPQPRPGKKHVILTSWASVATALLMVVLIGGAFYVADLKTKECKDDSLSEHNTKDYQRTYNTQDGETLNEDFHLDEDEQTELIVKKSDDGNIEMITAIDYRTKISASYIPSAEQCLLLAGEDMKWIDNWNMDDNNTVETLDDDVEMHEYKSAGNKVTDLSILPRATKPFCDGKPTYWLHEDDDDDDTHNAGHTLQKRARGCRTVEEESCTTRTCGWWGRRTCSVCRTYKLEVCP